MASAVVIVWYAPSVLFCIALYVPPEYEHIVFHWVGVFTPLFLSCFCQGDCAKAKKELGWVPEITFKELVKDMMESDIANVDAGNDHT